MSREFDVIVLGAGMAGASVAAELARERRVLLLETEPQAARHSTGRSAAMFFESYGNPTVRALTRASRHFFEHPPGGFVNAPVLSPRDTLFVADRARVARLDEMAQLQDATNPLQRLGVDASLRECPILRREWVAGGVRDTSGCDLDVAAIHQGYLRLGRRAGMQVVLDARETSIARRSGDWRVDSAAGAFSAPVLVNATGAWADLVARNSGVRPIGLEPLRRTCVTIPAPDGQDLRRWPMVIDIDEEFYFKPEAGQILLSPANEDLSDPCDAVPEELDIAIAIDRFERATTVEVKRLNHRWAGLRSFVADRSPVAGFDDQAAGFFWLAGQGGYGIQMAPALARLAAAFVLGRDIPEDIRAQGVTAEGVSPQRSGLHRR